MITSSAVWRNNLFVQFIYEQEAKDNLWKVKKLQHRGDVQDYIVMMEDLNYQVCL
jgi:hypothetical protein